MIPAMAIQPEPVMTLPEPPSSMPGNDCIERCDDCFITGQCSSAVPVIRRPRHVHCLACPGNTYVSCASKLLYHIPALRRRYSFFSTALIASFSSANSAYIRFYRLFSDSNSLTRASSDASSPPYFAFHL